MQYDTIATLVVERMAAAGMPRPATVETPDCGYQDGPALFFKDAPTGRECMVSYSPNDDPEDDDFYAAYEGMGLGLRAPVWLVDGYNRDTRQSFYEGEGKSPDEVADVVVRYFNRLDDRPA